MIASDDEDAPVTPAPGPSSGPDVHDTLPYTLDTQMVFEPLHKEEIQFVAEGALDHLQGKDTKGMEEMASEAGNTEIPSGSGKPYVDFSPAKVSLQVLGELWIEGLSAT